MGIGPFYESFVGKEARAKTYQEHRWGIGLLERDKAQRKEVSNGKTTVGLYISDVRRAQVSHRDMASNEGRSQGQSC
jgi:hypothetical protein